MSYATVRAATSPELTYLRTAGQWSRLYLAVFKPTSVYTARLSSVPTSNDRVVQLSFTGGSGTLADIRKDMTLYVGSTAGAYDLGVARIRKSAIAGTLYIGEESDILWNTSVSGGIYLTVVNEFDLWARHINTVNDTTFYMDYDVTYTNQNSVFDPIPIMGGHRVLKLTGSTIATQFNFSNSYVLNSSISSYSCSCPTASSSSGMTTSTPTITFNSAGWHPVYLTVTAANGKSYTGVRYVYVYSAASMPAQVFQLGNCSVDYDTGGWSFDVTMQDDISLSNVPERALCILFAEEYYGDTSTSIGQLAGCENIIAIGKISEESISIDSEQSEITLKIQGYQHWFSQVFAFPTGVILTASTPTNWAEMQSPTVDKVLYRLLHWGCTATTIMDIYLTNDTLLASELTSPASNLWAQVQEISFETIQARPGVDRFTRLFIEIEPQLVPVASRTYATVMTLTKDDYQDPVNIQRLVVTPSGAINASGVVVQSSGTGSALFSLSPGHVFKHYGDIEIVDRLLLSNQSLSNQMAGLIHAWRNNQYPSNEFILAGNYRMIDCFPRQRISWSVAAVDSPRAFTINGYFIPRRIELSWNPESGLLTTSISLEMETSETTVSYQNGDIPGDGGADLSSPPVVPAFPPLPDFSSIILPIDVLGLEDDFPPKWIGHDTVAGFLYTLNFNAASPDYLSMNSGLSPTVVAADANWIGVCPNGAIYVGRMATSTGWLARAASLGDAWTLVNTSGKAVLTAAINPSVPEQIGFLTAAPGDPTAIFHVGTYASFNAGVAIGGSYSFYARPHSLSYFSPGGWLLTTFDAYGKINSAGTAVTSSASLAGIAVAHIRGGASNVLYTEGNASNSKYSFDNLGHIGTFLDAGVSIVSDSSGINYINFDCDPTGRFIMTRVGSLGNKNKSSDYGATWSSLSSLPAGTQWCFAYAGMNGSLPRFAVANAVVRATTDFGSTWDEKTTASLNAIVTFPNINFHKFVGLVPYGNP